MKVLVVNAGSSSLKLSVVDESDRAVASADTGGDGDLASQVGGLLDDSGPVGAVGHRVVHGGADHVRPERVTEQLVADLRELVPLAPLHQPAALDGIEAVGKVLPDVPAVACFDTAFHADLPAAAATYAVPREWTQRYGLRRYGMHGLSHSYAARRAADMTDGRARRVVVAHLGSGASLAAVSDGRSVDTTMGFTPMEGLVMATRTGSLDPGMLLWLVGRDGMSAEDVQDGIDRRGGLLGLAGTKDMKEVVDGADRGDTGCALALDVYLHRLASSIAAMTVSLGGLDAMVFTGGVGEAAPRVRSGAADRLAHLGVELDPSRNESDLDVGDRDISATGARVTALVVAAREDVSIARDVRGLLAPDRTP
ncbi:MAG: acetate kinase [Actinomycetota bacterium]|nr:acetate kinase [Actinomycetota bacterium]